MKWYDYLKTFRCVKSLVTIAMTGVFIYMCIIGTIDKESFMNVFLIVISFYFSRQWEKNDNDKENKK